MPSYTSLRVLAPPSNEPVSIDTLRKHLRVDQDFDDDLLAVYLTTARDQAERFLNRALISQTLQLFLMRRPDEGWPAGGWRGHHWPLAHRHAIELPRPPCQSIVSLSVLDSIGNTTAIAFPNAISAGGSSTLQFPQVGFPSFVATGTSVTDLAGSAIPIGATVSGITEANGQVAVTLSAALAAPVNVGDAVVLSSAVPALPLPVPTSPSPPLSLFFSDLSLEPARARLDWPVLNGLQTVTGPIQHIEIDYIAGYGNQAAVPQSIITAILMLAAFLYERRGDDGGEMPSFIERLLWPYRVPVFGD